MPYSLPFAPRCRALGTTALTALLVVASVLVATPTHAGSADRWTVPSQAWVTLTGHGFGHGHGMSQYGAEGAARSGLTHREIIDFYYPGTTWGQATGRVSVMISADTTDDLVVLARPGLSLRDTAVAGRTTLPENGADQWRITVAPDGRNQVAYRTDRWRPFATLKGEGEFFADGLPITLVTPSGDRTYRGRLRAAAPTVGARSRDTVNELSLEHYLKGVVPLEMPALWQPEAVRAQAVAARTYASYERSHPRAKHYQLCDTTSCQVYGGYDAEHPASNEAVAATRQLALLADGKPAFTQFSASSGGWTSAGSFAYLPARQDPHDDWAGNPVHTWTVKLMDTRLEGAWPAIGDLKQIVVNRRDGNGEWGGRLREVTITGSRGRVTVSGDTFRSVLGLRSTWLTFKVTSR